MQPVRLYMLLIGATLHDRHTEQHDIFFGIATSLKELVPDIITFWPGAKLHLDAWREVTTVDGYAVQVVERHTFLHQDNSMQLFFLNLGGYKRDEFEEFHYKLIVAAADKGDAIQRSKKTAFYKHTGFKGAGSHVDDSFGVDVDDVHKIAEILPKRMKELYTIRLLPCNPHKNDEVHFGYFKLNHL